LVEEASVMSDTDYPRSEIDERAFADGRDAELEKLVALLEGTS
jgi:hypothetical protein